MQGRALVTGAGQRLGQAIALYLGSRGFDVAVHYARSRDGAQATAARLQAQGCRAEALGADLLDEAQSVALVGRAAAALGGPLTLLVNNASIFEHDTIASASRESWDRHIESNLRAPFVLTQCFADQAPKALVKSLAQPDRSAEPRAQALVVNMIDQRVLKPTPHFTSYTIAKMGLWALTRISAQALAPHVRVNAIGPGPTMRGIRQSESHFARQRAATLLGRGADPEDITAALGYLIDASSVTGQLLCVDGGQHLNWQTPDVLGLED